MQQYPRPHRPVQPGQQPPYPYYPPGFPLPEEAPPKKRFRWWLILVPAVFLLAMWIAQGLDPAFKFEDVMNSLRVPGRSRESYTQLASLGVMATAVVVIHRMLTCNKRP